ncbi:MAG: desulforedoxin [Chloroflexi bacterium]|nr:desulforedoxin [Chloroflexota bacterium]
MVHLANETGKRYSCAKCGSEFVVTRGADGTIECCGKPMAQK